VGSPLQGVLSPRREKGILSEIHKRKKGWRTIREEIMTQILLLKERNPPATAKAVI